MFLSLVFAQSPLLLCVLHDLLLHIQAFAAADGVHVFQRLVRGVGLLPKVQVLLFCGGHPVRVAADHLPVAEDELRTGQAAGAFADLVSEAKALCDG